MGKSALALQARILTCIVLDSLHLRLIDILPSLVSSNNQINLLQYAFCD